MEKSKAGSVRIRGRVPTKAKAAKKTSRGPVARPKNKLHMRVGNKIVPVERPDVDLNKVKRRMARTIRRLGIEHTPFDGPNDDIVRARINAEVKAQAEAVLTEIGLDPSAAFRMMMIRIAREGRLPFDPYVPNETTLAAIAEAKAGKTKKFATVAALLADVDAEDD